MAARRNGCALSQVPTGLENGIHGLDDLGVLLSACRSGKTAKVLAFGLRILAAIHPAYMVCEAL